ncbi:unnamed protein product, partial [Lactuca virosa]
MVQGTKKAQDNENHGISQSEANEVEEGETVAEEIETTPVNSRDEGAEPTTNVPVAIITNDGHNFGKATESKES